MKKKILFIIASILIVFSFSCSKEDKIGERSDPNAPAPPTISDIKIQEIAGGAILTYKIPTHSNLSYIKAVYEIQPGVFREAKSSIYSDTLSIIGYGDTSAHVVKVYSVGKNKKTSEPLTFTFKPKEPPVLTAFETLVFEATFGGVTVGLKNLAQGNLTVKVIVDSTGLNTWAPVATFYTSTLSARFAARGFKPVEKRFGVYLVDRWGNKSDTIKKVLVPVLEELIPKSNFREVKLPTDTYLFVESYSMPRIWDDKHQYNIFATPHTSLMPQWFTFDLGKNVILSRMKSFHYFESPYAGSSVKKFEIWGSNSPDTDGGWDNWKLLGTFDSFKPSGKPVGSNTADDVNYAISKGEDFEFGDQFEPIRYIRFKTLETWGGGKQVVITELTFWGQMK